MLPKILVTVEDRGLGTEDRHQYLPNHKVNNRGVSGTEKYEKIGYGLPRTNRRTDRSDLRPSGAGVNPEKETPNRSRPGGGGAHREARGLRPDR